VFLYLLVLNLRHNHVLEIIHAEHSHEHVDTPAQFVDAMRLDAHDVLAHVEVDVDDILVVIVLRLGLRGRLRGSLRGRWRGRQRRQCLRGWRRRREEVEHVIEEGERLEGARRECVDVDEEVLVELGLIARRVVIVIGDHTQTLDLLAIELLEINGRRRGWRRQRPCGGMRTRLRRVVAPEVCDRTITDVIR
jgi:hypothetical protein